MDTAHDDNAPDLPSPDRGASVVEYALLVALLAVVSLGAISFAGDSAEAMFDHVGNDVVSGSSGVPVAAPPAGGGGADAGGGADGSGGDGSGGDGSGGDGSGGGSGGDGSGGDGSGDGGSGGDDSGGGGAAPEPVVASTTFEDVDSRWVYRDDWRSEATVVLRDEDGQPLSDATVRVKVITYERRYGSWRYVDTDYENYQVDAGEVELSHRYDEDDVERVVYEIVRVTFDDLDGPSWDESDTRVTINKP